MRGPDDTTDKLFPPPENPNPDAPIPIGPSLRIVWKQHQEDIEKRFRRFEELLEERAAPSPKSAARRVLTGAATGGRAVVFCSGLLGLAALAAKLWKPELVGPIETIQQLFGP